MEILEDIDLGWDIQPHKKYHWDPSDPTGMALSRCDKPLGSQFHFLMGGILALLVI
jgi:hypothetical protein